MLQEIKKCRACNNEHLTEFLDLGEQYLSDFRRDNEKPPKYPLVAVFCEDCKLVQLKHTTPQDEMYHDRYGFKSGVSNSIKEDLKDNVRHVHEYVPNPKNWLDIASNDGTLLSFVRVPGWKVGVDPVTFLCAEAQKLNKVNTYIINDYFSKDRMPFKEFDAITSISCFYDMPDPNEFVSDVANVLSEKGVWVIQQNYMMTTMELSAVDNFCHEHLEYYTLIALENVLNRHGLEVNEVLLSEVNGGSIRTIVSHKGTFPVKRSVELQRQIEKEYGLETIDSYVAFAGRVTKELDKLREFIEDVNKQGKKVCILAASTRGATIWQSAGLTDEHVLYAVERNPAKVGAMFSAIGVPIVSEEQFREDKPDYAIIGPWFFKDEIIERESEYLKNGGQLIIPLPKVKIRSWANKK